MSIASVVVDGVEYEVAPMEPEKHDRPSPAFPMAVTPQIARSWLRYNYRNRNQRATGKRDYATDMVSGNYDINGTTVTFSRPLKEGEDENVPVGSVMLIDGQHRLQACIDAGVPFVVYVAYGIKPEARRTVDTGIKRSFHDVLFMDGEEHAVQLASVVKRAYFWDQGDKHLRMREESFTHQQGQEFLAHHPELRRSTEVTVQGKDMFKNTAGIALRGSVAGLAHWLFMKADETQAPEFFARVFDGDGLKLDHPISILRRRLVKDKTQKTQIGSRRDYVEVPDWTMMCYFIRSWNMYLAGPRPDGVYPEFLLLGRNDITEMPAIETASSILTSRIRKERERAIKEAS